MGSNNRPDRFSIEEKKEFLPQQIWWKNSKTQTKQNSNSHTETEIYKVIPLRYEQSSWGGNSPNPFKVFELPKLCPTNINLQLAY